MSRRRSWPGPGRAGSVLGWTHRLEEDLAMSDHTPEPGNAGSEPDLSHTAEFAKLRAVMRASEKHREGGVDPELEDEDADSGHNT